jgi:hypothetical protein
MIVINHRPRLHNLLMAAPPPKEGVEPSGAQHSFEKVLYPGANEVDDRLWAIMEKDPVIRAHIEDGDLEVPAKDRFAAMTPKQAVELVKGTTDVKLLKKWGETEKRKVVIEAIEAQVKEVELKEEAE